jgi:hypothetical protein
MQILSILSKIEMIYLGLKFYFITFNNIYCVTSMYVRTVPHNLKF